MKPNPTDWLVTPDLNKPDEWTYPIKHDAILEMDYYADMDRHMTHDASKLRSKIGDRTLGVMLHGASINELENRAKEFRDLDMCYMSINRFEVMERRILSKMGKRLDIVFLMSEQEMPRRIQDLHRYLDRGDNILMTTFSTLSWLEREDYMHIIWNHDEQLYVMPRLLCRPVYPISLALILDQMVICKVRDIVLFGADGYVPDSENDVWNQEKMLATYYDPGYFKATNRPCGLAFGTKHFNETYEYDDTALNVINCSENSHIKHFRKIGYDQLRETVNAH